MIETTTQRRLLRWRRKCVLQHRGRDGAVPKYIFSELRRGTEYQNGAAESLWTTATTHRVWFIIKFWDWLMPQAWKIKNGPKPFQPNFCYVCSLNFCCTIYTGPIQRALKKEHPCARPWRVLEDNDPTGFNSKAGKQRRGRQASKASAFPIGASRETLSTKV